MSASEFHTYEEIRTQTAAWSQALELASSAAPPRSADYEQVIFTGCGSTYYLSLAAAALFQELTGRPARAVPAGELWLNPRLYLPERETLLVAVSRSGTTSETVKAAERFRADRRGPLVAITNHRGSLAPLADVSIVIEQGQEQSVAQTRSFASMYLATVALCARMAGRGDLLSSLHLLPEAGQRLIARYEPLAVSLGRDLDLDRLYFLGSGIRYGLACEISLKMKEMTLTHSEPFHFTEFRHGPMSMANGQALVVGLLSDSARTHEARVLTEMRALGARTLSLGELDADVAFSSGVLESARGVLYLPVLQLMAFHRSLAKGLNPDRPANLTAVVQLDL